ncbi:unnamed protein product, partial [Ectocarpus fasciculatus]
LPILLSNPHNTRLSHLPKTHFNARFTPRVLHRTTLSGARYSRHLRCRSLFAIAVVFTNRRLQSPLSNLQHPSGQTDPGKNPNGVHSFSENSNRERKDADKFDTAAAIDIIPDECHKQVRLRRKQLAGQR